MKFVRRSSCLREQQPQRCGFVGGLFALTSTMRREKEEQEDFVSLGVELCRYHFFCCDGDDFQGLISVSLTFSKCPCPKGFTVAHFLLTSISFAPSSCFVRLSYILTRTKSPICGIASCWVITVSFLWAIQK